VDGIIPTWEARRMNLILAFTHHPAMRLAEVGFLLVLFAGI
jgi:hypothetical protein